MYRRIIAPIRLDKLNFISRRLQSANNISFIGHIMLSFMYIWDWYITALSTIGEYNHDVKNVVCCSLPSTTCYSSRLIVAVVSIIQPYRHCFPDGYATLGCIRCIFRWNFHHSFANKRYNCHLYNMFLLRNSKANHHVNIQDRKRKWITELVRYMISYYPQWVVLTISSITLSKIYSVSLVHRPDCLWSIMVFIMLFTHIWWHNWKWSLLSSSIFSNGSCHSDFRCVNCKHNLRTDILKIQVSNILERVKTDRVDGESTLPQLLAWFRQATNDNLLTKIYIIWSH